MRIDETTLVRLRMIKVHLLLRSQEPDHKPLRLHFFFEFGMILGCRLLSHGHLWADFPVPPHPSLWPALVQTCTWNFSLTYFGWTPGMSLRLHSLNCSFNSMQLSQWAKGTPTFALGPGTLGEPPWPPLGGDGAAHRLWEVFVFILQVNSFLCPLVFWTKNVSPGRGVLEKEAFLLHPESIGRPKAWACPTPLSWTTRRPTLPNARWRERLSGGV